MAEWPEVKVLGRDLSRSKVIADLVGSGRVTFLTWDLSEADPHPDVVKQLQPVTDVIHAASVVEDPPPTGPEAARMIRVNVSGTIYLLRQLPNLRHICYFSSVAVYGPPKIVPCPEFHPTEPTRLYGVTKLAVENLLRIHAEHVGITLSVLRPSSVYGFPDPTLESTRAIPTFMRRCVAGEPIRIIRTGSLLRDYVHVLDVIEATMTAVSHRVSGTYNIASGEGRSLLEIARMVGEVVGVSPEILEDTEHGPDPDFCTDIVYDISSAKKHLGYGPRVRMHDALRWLCKAYCHQTRWNEMRAEKG